MKTTHKFTRATVTILGMAAILLSALHVPPASAQKGDGIQRDYNAETGKVSHITGLGNEPITISGAMSANMDSQERSEVLVNRFAPEFGLTRPEEELQLSKESLPSPDRVVTRYQQVYNGIPVIAGELIVNASDKGALHSMNGEVAQGLSLDTNPSLSSETAIAIAKQGMVKWYEGAADDYTNSDVILSIFDESLIQPSIRPAELVWHMELTPTDQSQPVRELVLVNAETGNISLHFNQVDTAWHATHHETESVYNTFATSTDPSQLSTIERMPAQSGNTWYVATTGNDANSCLAPASPCATIQGAIDKAANGGDTIQVAVGTYTRLGSGLDVVLLNKNLALSGGWDAGFVAQIGHATIDGLNNNRGVSVTAAGSLDRFIITNGNRLDGGGVYSGGSVPLTITNSIIQNNLATNGGGIYYSGSLIIENSSIVGNHASNLGGGIVVNFGGNLYLHNSTIGENTSSSPGGGLFTYGSAIVRNSTIAYNTAADTWGGGIVANHGSSITLLNSIVAKNTAAFFPANIPPSNPDCSGAITSNGNNIVGIVHGNCSITPTSGDLFGVNPILGSHLIGFPSYYPLLAGSPAIGTGNVNTCLATDQRGVDRLGDASCDIGAYEFTLPGPVNSLHILSGSGQSIPYDVPFPESLYVVALDIPGTPVEGASVFFTAPVSGASAVFPKTGTNETSAITNNEGIASSSIIRANDQAGSYNVLASTSGVPGSISFTLTNISGGKYVTTAGNDSNSCSTPASPCLTINAAVNKASAGEAIYIADGIYSENVQNLMLNITKDLTFSGNWNNTFTSQSGNTIIDGQLLRGVFKINLGVDANIYDITVRNGYASQGAGIYNQGNLTLKNVAIANNRTFNDGAGIYQQSGQLNLENVTISNNTAKSSGGGIYVYDGTVTINNSTITQNFVADPGALAIGGGLSNYFNKPVTIKNAVIAGNGSESAPDCRGQIISAGYNLIGFVEGCDITPATGDQIGAIGSPLNAMLGNLADNGGSTLTHALLTGSPAIDAGDLATCASTDQRGVARPQGAVCDIGAYEGSTVQTISTVVRTYTANNANVLPGNLLCDQTDPTCTEGTNLRADKAHQYALGTYDLYANQHGRNGIDQNNMPIISTVDYCSSSFCPYYNAFWSGGQMVFGSTFALADDVVAHELTHGVTQYESGLLYYYQSGAINESFSDLWGEYYDQTNGLGNDDPSVKWAVSEDVTGVGPFRSMSNPPLYGDPDKMTSSLYNKKVYYDDFWDNGGVHSNSGVNNKAVFLLVDGGTFNSKTVTALGWEKTGAIYYEVQTNLLSSGSDYSDLYYALQQACANLIGQFGITAADCLEVKDALDAVQMNSQPTANFNPDAPFCPTGMVTSPILTHFQDDLESGTGNWALSSYWTLEDFYASSATHMLFGDDDATSSDSMATATISMPLPAGAFLHFKHAFAFEYYGSTYWDGGVLEYTTNGGATWIDAKPLFSAGQNYTKTIYSPNSSNALKGRSAFAGDSHGYVSTRYNLASLAGQNAQFRWRFATDQFVSYYGWFLDDVKIYTCTGTPSTPTLKTPTSNALLTHYTPLLDWNDATLVDHYELQIATDMVFTSMVYNETSVPASNFTVPSDLASNTTYHWKVRGVNGIGSPGAWSVSRYFRTALTPPTLVAPADEFHALTLRPPFDWDPVVETGVTGYTIQISKNDIFTMIVHTGNTTSSATEYTPTADLPKGITLFWRVQTKGANGPSAWSPATAADRSFLSANSPTTPVLSLPASNALNTNYLPLFKWSAVTVPVPTTFQHYQLQVDDNADFSSPVLDDTSITDRLIVQFQTIAPLPHNTKFYWRVRAVNTDNEVSNWSAVKYFRTALTPPTLGSPNNGFDALTLRPLFDWDPVVETGLTGYTIQISKNNTFTMIVHTGNPLNSEYTPTADLPKNLPLFWRVQSKGANGPSAWSEVRSFNSANSPTTPALSLPASNALITNYLPLFKWSVVTLPVGTTFQRYQLQVDDNADFSSPVLDDTSVTDRLIVQFQTIAPLPHNTKFYWRVRAVNTDNEVSNWSAVKYFRTMVTAPTLLTPTDASTVAGDLTPTFDWMDATGPGAITGYTIQVSTSPTFSSNLVNATTPLSTYTPIANLPANTTLYWRVRINGVNGPSYWSSSFSLTVTP